MLIKLDEIVTMIDTNTILRDSQWNRCTPSFSLENQLYRLSISTSQNKSEEEEENKEPPKKKEKIMTTSKKASKLSLKQKASNQPLSHGNK